MFAALLDLLTRPRQFFADRQEPRLRYAALAVAVSSLPGAGIALLFFWWFRNVVPFEALVVVSAMLPVVLAIVDVLAWLVLAAVAYALSYPVAGRGGGRRLLAYVGWGTVPRAVTGLLAVGGVALVLVQFAPPADEAAAEAMGRQLNDGAGVALAVAAGTARATATGTLSDVQTVTGVGGALWSGYVWTAALERARGLDRRWAAAVAAVPVLLLVAVAAL